jgi:hypothetical protein
MASQEDSDGTCSATQLAEESSTASGHGSAIESFFSEDELTQLAFLRDEEVDELVSASYLEEDARLGSPLDSPLQFKFTELILHVRPSKTYPVLLHTTEFFSVENLQLPRITCDELRAALHAVCDDALHTNTLSVWNAREDLDPFGIFKRAMLILQLAQRTEETLKEHRVALAARTNLGNARVSGVQVNAVEQKAPSTTLSASEMARAILGSPEDIAGMIPPYWRVLHVEEILRRNLANKFYAARDDLRQQLQKRSPQTLYKFQPSTRRKGDAVESLVKPQLTFHGTTRAAVPSIVRHGFLKPGARLPPESTEDADVHEVRCGSTYGRGIYSSPSPGFALSYSGEYCEPTSPSEFFGLKLIACAVLMGRAATMTRADNWRTQERPFPGSDSHVANNQMEYIVFESARILPVYVLHLDWGEGGNAQHLLHIPADPDDWTQAGCDRAWWRRGARHRRKAACAGDRQRQREAVVARARKWFPYGFGPGTGASFAVEEVGYVSEDEEDYGQYQAVWATEEGHWERDGMGYWSWFKAGHEEDQGAGKSVDEYGAARGGLAMEAEEWKKIPTLDQLGQPIVKMENETDWSLEMMLTVELDSEP